VLAAGAAPAVDAQVPLPAPRPRPLGPGTRSGEPRLNGGAALSIAQPVHDFRDHVANGVGGAGHAFYRLGARGAFALRADLGFLTYGRERRRIPIVPGTGRLTADLTTTNNIFWLGVGPQFMAPAGAVRPYANAGAGFAAFSTTSTLEDRNSDEVFARDNNQSDVTWAVGAGGGVLVPVWRRARQMVSLDLGGRFHRNGRVRYLREGGIVDLPDGTSRFDVIDGPADLWTFHVGVSFGGR
jgi:opacity protein-like surface antigen